MAARGARPGEYVATMKSALGRPGKTKYPLLSGITTARTMPSNTSDTLVSGTGRPVNTLRTTPLIKLVPIGMGGTWAGIEAMTYVEVLARDTGNLPSRADCDIHRVVTTAEYPKRALGQALNVDNPAPKSDIWELPVAGNVGLKYLTADIDGES